MDKWNGHIVAAPGDREELERRASVHQFAHGLERNIADTRAYVDYKSDQHARAAAHHLKMSQALVSAGNREDAEKSRNLYEMHVQALGHKKSAVPPAEVRAHMDANTPHERVHGFKQHGADKLLGS